MSYCLLCWSWFFLLYRSPNNFLHLARAPHNVLTVPAVRSARSASNGACLSSVTRTQIAPEEAPNVRWACVDFLVGVEVAAVVRGLGNLARAALAVPTDLRLVSSRASAASVACSATHSDDASGFSREQANPGLIMKVASTAIAAYLFMLATTVAGLAQSCTSTICYQYLFGQQCVRFACSSDAQCFPERPSCIGGVCQICSGSTGGGGGGIGQSGEGGRCGPQRFGGGVIKSIGCQRGLVCNRIGRCQQVI